MATRPWTPADYAAGTLANWHDPSVAANITTGATFTDIDKSGNGYNETQTAAGLQPVYPGPTIGGLATEQFSGNKVLQSTLSQNGTLVRSFIFLVQIAAASTHTLSGGQSGGIQFRIDTNGSLTLNRQSASQIANGGTGTGKVVAVGTPSIAAASYNEGTGAWSLRLTGGAVASGTTNAAIDGTVSTIGSAIPGGDLQSLNGLLGERITLNTTTLADIQYAEGYLAWKWGQQGSLPADHPYKAAAPTVTTADTGTDYPASATDAGAATDAVSATGSAQTITADIGAAASTETATASVAPSVTDIGAATDTVIGSSANTGIASDASASTDQSSAVAAASGTATDGGTGSDVSTGRATVSASISDAGTASDSNSASQAAVASLADVGTGTDAVSATSVPNGATADVGSASDAVTARAGAVAAISDAGGGADAVGYAGQIIVPVIPPYVQPISPPGSGGTSARGGRYSSYDPVLHRRREQEEEEARRPRPVAAEKPALPVLGAPLILDPMTLPTLSPDAALGALPALPALVDPTVALLADDEDAIALLLAA